MVPFADDAVPPVIGVITAWIWAYRLYRHREVMEIPAAIKDDYARAMDMIKSILDGSLDIGPGSLELAQVPRVRSSPVRGWTCR